MPESSPETRRSNPGKYDDSPDPVVLVTEVQRRIGRLRTERNKRAKAQTEAYGGNCADLATTVKAVADQAAQARMDRQLQLWKRWVELTGRVETVRETIAKVGRETSDEFLGFTAQLETVFEGVLTELQDDRGLRTN